MSPLAIKSAPKFGQREAIWSSLNQHAPWDMLVIGGGITGAGVVREAAKRGLKVLLIDQRDFSWGTSSRSSKMVHGGLRYLTQGDFKLTHEAVNERQRMLDEAPGLVEPMKYVFPFRKGQKPHRILFNIALKMYDWFAGRPDYKSFDKDTILSFLPNLNETDLYGGTQYTDAVTDDSRLVMRVLHEAIADGATVLNYVKANEIIREGGSDTGKVTGVEVENQRTGEVCQINAKVVVSATGAWADELRGELVDEKRIRPLRGSHIVVPAWRLPVYQALTFQHPNDGRFTFIYPWEGTTVIGTTDLDHRENLDLEAGITQEEVDYILAGANAQFPNSGLGQEDVLTTWSGVRPIVAEEGVDALSMNPSDARRSHSVWNNQGLITVTGGKLTTFRTMALEVLDEVKDVLSFDKNVSDRVFTPVTDKLMGAPHLGCEQHERLQGFYGLYAQDVVDYAEEGELSYIPGSLTLWAEVRWLCANESIEHLDDLMLRRTRLGLTVYKGGLNLMPRLRDIIQQELSWDDARWDDELSRYTHIWTTKYSLPVAL